MSELKRQSVTRKIQIIPIGDKEEINRVYEYIRNAMYVQNKAYNILISRVYADITSGNVDNVSDTYKRGSRKPKENDAEYSLYNVEDFQNIPVGLPLFANTSFMAKHDMATAKSKGLYKGKISLQNRKIDAPLYVNKKYIQIKHLHNDYNEFIDKLYTNDLQMGFAFTNGINFKLVFGNLKKSHELRSVAQNIIEENYIIQDSSISFDRTGKKIMLNLCLSIPCKDKKALNEEICVGVHFGAYTPIVCALNSQKKVVEYIGDKDEIDRVFAQIRLQRKRIRNHMKSTNGGHGTPKRMQALKRIEGRLRNFENTYSHYLSKSIVAFALKNKAKYIIVEEAPADSDNRAIGVWQFFKLNEQIKYKAKQYGIEVIEGISIDIEETGEEYVYAKEIASNK